MENMYALTAAELIARMRAGDISVSGLTKAYLRRIERFNGSLNAIAELDPTALQQAQRLEISCDRSLPLFGLPVLIKDNIDAAGLHTTAGSLALNDNIAAKDAPVVAALRRCGAVILGKTNMTEFANYTAQGMPNGYSSRGGQVISAYGAQKDPGGSSTGSAVALSAGLCAAAIGTDTLFSVVGCAAENGIVGLKPPIGALSADGIVPISRTLDSAGIFARNMQDALLIYGSISGRSTAVTPAEAQGLRIAVNTTGRENVSPAQLDRYETLFAKLRAAGAVVDEVPQPFTRCYREIMRCEFRRDLEAYLAGTSAAARSLDDIIGIYSHDPERMLRYGMTLLEAARHSSPNDADYAAAMTERERLKTELTALLSGYDACIMTGSTGIFHVCALPSVTLTLGAGDDGMPKGIILYGTDEQRLYRAALTIERFCPPAPSPALEE